MMQHIVRLMSPLEGPPTLQSVRGHLKASYPLRNTIQNIAIGILGAGLRIAAHQYFFAASAATSSFSPLIVALFVLKSCFLAPIVEESIFRKILLGGMLEDIEKEKLGTLHKVKAIAISALIFGLFHFFAPHACLQDKAINVVTSSIGGLIYGVEFALTGNLWASTISHSLYNARILF